jgi:hypothetical protein
MLSKVDHKILDSFGFIQKISDLVMAKVKKVNS